MVRYSFPRHSFLAATLVGLTLAGSQAAAQTAAERGYQALLTVPLEPPILTEQQYFDLWQHWPERNEAGPPRQRRRSSGR